MAVSDQIVHYLRAGLGPNRRQSAGVTDLTLDPVGGK